MVIDPNRTLRYKFPEIAKEWHSTKNSNLTPNEITYGSGKKVWWQCAKYKNHEWEAVIYCRTKNDGKGTGCPFCAGNKFSFERSLANKFPEIAVEWHAELNKDTSPNDVSYGSTEKYWWQCSKYKDHQWEASIYRRTIDRTGCPFCAQGRINPENRLSILFPEVSVEWHTTKNGNLKSSEFTIGTHKKVWWQCSKYKDHQWEASISNRTRNGGKGSDCPYCSGQKVGLERSLAYKFPDIAAQWHATKNGDLKPNEVTYGSNEKVWWQCPKVKSHVYDMGIKLRTKGQNCPFCRGLRVSRENSLATNFPEIAKEWHPTLNKKLTPESVVCGSGKKVWWQCLKSKDHIWEAQIYHRTKSNNPTNCPYCSNQSSIPEIRILSELEIVFDNVISRKKIEKREIDIFLSDINLGIEFDGFYYHKEKFKKDIIKNNYLLSKGISLIRVREKPLEKTSNNDIILRKEELIKSDINKILEKIIELRYISNDKDLLLRINEYLQKDEFQNEKIFKVYLDCFPSPLPGDSMQCMYPDISNQWHVERNDPLLPRNFTPGSHSKVWWQCSKYKDHEWEAEIRSRVRGYGCPYCSGKKVSPETSLAYKFPDIANEWHASKNGNKTPNDFTYGSKETVWWQCSKYQNHAWEAHIKNRTGRGDGCPFCAGKKVSPETSLAYKFPDIANEWHASKNGNKTPNDFTPGSHSKVWWQCPKHKDHEWETVICARTRNDGKGTGCPYCSGNRKK